MRKNKNNETTLPLTISSKDGLVDQITYFNKQVSSKDMSGYYLLKSGEFAYNKSYSVGYDYGSIKRLERYPMGALSTLYICFKLTQFDSDFIKVYFDSLKWYKEIYMIAAEGARNHGLLNVSVEEFFNTKHTLPSNINEQKKISRFLLLLEKRIEKQQRLVESLKSYKRGVLRKVFDFTEEPFRSATLGELCHITTGKLDANAMVEKGKYRFYTCAKEHYYINTYAFNTEALLISGNGANVGYIHHYNGKFNAYQRTYVLTDFVGVNPTFLEYYLETYLSERIESEKKAGNTPYIVLSTLSEMKIICPNIETQNTISKLFKHLDLKIKKEEDVLYCLQDLKNGLLQKMFI